MAIVIKKLFVNAENQKQFVDVVKVEYGFDILDNMCRAVCTSFPEVLGIYCIDVEAQLILQKWTFDTTLDPPSAVRIW